MDKINRTNLYFAILEIGESGLPINFLWKMGFKSMWSQEAKVKLTEFLDVDMNTEVARMLVVEMLRMMPRAVIDAVTRLMFPKEKRTPELKKMLLEATVPFMDDSVYARLVGPPSERKDRCCGGSKETANK